MFAYFSPTTHRIDNLSGVGILQTTVLDFNIPCTDVSENMVGDPLGQSDECMPIDIGDTFPDRIEYSGKKLVASRKHSGDNTRVSRANLTSLENNHHDHDDEGTVEYADSCIHGKGLEG
ncbi:MAG: hypothetical protein V4481_04440 [Patescibacteria group bacterium]